ncbi:MAG: hypothetical protein WAX14_08315 [Rhodococcus sp. (in: high G+C Gram-positive bacteria)]|uniref:hypothetical protein n=1 Tax=Rhodococcus sp. TaxID=1831 RepID=UPI003BB72F6D
MPLTDKELRWVTGGSGIDAVPPGTSDLRHRVLDRLGSDSEIVSGNLTTYARFATIVPTDPDWPFLVRVLRECRLAADRLTSAADIDAFHLEPPATGHRGWDAIIAGVAEITGVDRVSHPEILRWCRNPARFCTELFDPLGTGKYRWLEYLRTPIQLRERNVILAAGNLEGV